VRFQGSDWPTSRARTTTKRVTRSDGRRSGRSTRRAHGKKGACVTGREGGVTGWRSFAGFASALSVTSAPTWARRKKKNVFGSRSSRLAERDSISTRPRRSWRERARGGAPGEWSPRCCRPRFRRSRPGNCCAGGGGGSAGGVSSGRRGGRRREEEGGPGRPGFEGRNLSGVPRRVVPRCAPPGPRASSRARARRRGWCGPPPGQLRGPSCAGPRGARS
jgi:hypothetical protein